VVLVATGGGDGFTPTAAGIVWGLTAGVTYATWYLVGRGLAGRVGPVTIGAWSLCVGAVVLAPFAQLPPDATSWLLLLGPGAASTYLAALVYYSGLRGLPAARAAVIATLEPVAALALGAIVFGERLTVVATVGAVVIIAAAVAAGQAEQR
jgi:drug/metabolite transporter, DME family